MAVAVGLVLQETDLRVGRGREDIVLARVKDGAIVVEVILRDTLEARNC